MLTAFFDESGHFSATEFFSLTAFVAKDSDWALFDDRWREALTRSCAPYLHMREFAHKNRKIGVRLEFPRRGW